MNILKKIILPALIAVACVATIYLSSCAANSISAKKHPVEITKAPTCSECHTGKLATMNHGLDFVKKHKFFASRKGDVCIQCHRPSFCADCHSSRDGLKPNEREKIAVGRNMPHRGDYLIQHKIDGKRNPASCLRCHGRINSDRCAICHK